MESFDQGFTVDYIIYWKHFTRLIFAVPGYYFTYITLSTCIGRTQSVHFNDP